MTNRDLRAGAPTMVVHLRPQLDLTDDQFFDLCQRNPELRFERTADGDLLIMSPTGGETGRRNFKLIGTFHAWAESNGSGIGFDSSTGFILPNGAVRSPDMAWLRRERWDALSPSQRSRFIPLCPDFVVELLSPSDRLADAQEKMDEYIRNGARLGWLLDIASRRVFVYRSGEALACLEDPDTLEGDPLLPGFVLAARELFA